VKWFISFIAEEESASQMTGGVLRIGFQYVVSIAQFGREMLKGRAKVYTLLLALWGQGSGLA
jgi:hypothetical protein